MNKGPTREIARRIFLVGSEVKETNGTYVANVDSKRCDWVEPGWRPYSFLADGPIRPSPAARGDYPRASGERENDTGYRFKQKIQDPDDLDIRPPEETARQARKAFRLHQNECC